MFPKPDSASVPRLFDLRVLHPADPAVLSRAFGNLCYIQVVFLTAMVFNILVAGLLFWVENPDR